ncbi:MAG: HD domain-containing protein [Bacteroidales bacterium]|nr:HD domain-containing protein [Bacteroidales bacterium]
MNEKEILKQSADFVRQKLGGEGTGHDWWHIYRVWQTAKTISKEEGGNEFVIELAALLHDIADHKFHNGDESIGPRVATKFLVSLRVPKKIIDAVILIMEEISFSKGMTPSSLEGRIVQDADRLDAIGAIGIARAFAYGGHKQREIYNPDIPPVEYATKEEYKKNSNPTLNHFYEKLLLLKDLMNTAKGKAMAEQRHIFMKEYLDQFYLEWDGKR